MSQTKEQIDKTKAEQGEKTKKIVDVKKQNEGIMVTIHQKIKDKEVYHDKLRYAQNNRFAAEKETEN